MPFGEKWQKIVLNCRWGYKCTLCACMVCVSANMVSVARWQVSLPAKWVWKCCMHARQTRANLTVWVATYIHMHISYIYSCHNKWQHFGKFIWKKNTRSRNAFVKNKKKNTMWINESLIVCLTSTVLVCMCVLETAPNFALTRLLCHSLAHICINVCAYVCGYMHFSQEHVIFIFSANNFYFLVLSKKANAMTHLHCCDVNTNMH